MQDLEMKQKVAKEIMGLMDKMDGDRLKKHPKVMAASVQMKKPLDEEMDADPEEIEEMDGEVKDAKSIGEESEEEISPEVLKKLLEMMSEKA